MLLELRNIVKYVGGRCLFRIDNLKVYKGEKIGVIGQNGIGKSTLLDIMAGKLEPDEGLVHRYCSLSYIGQLDSITPANQAIDPIVMRQFSVGNEYANFMSGGEKARYKIAAALSKETALLLADEPTANLDIQGTSLVESKLREFDGTLVIVSHDRQLLDAVCNVIWEIEDGRLKVYPGNYTSYVAQKENEKKRQEREYQNYIKEKKQLEDAILDRKGRSASTRKTPKRMGNSEARLHKMGNQKAKANLDKAVKAIEARLNKLEVKERPKENLAAVFNFVNIGDLPNKVVIQGSGVSKAIGNRVLFKDAQFSILNGQKVALFGDNGCGKTTFLNMIAGRETPIHVSPNAQIGYFRQGMEDLDLDKTVLANVMTTSIYEESTIRGLLAQLLFRREDVFKEACVLSGGERTRLSLAKLIASEANVLFLDEPTNYLDLSSLEALEHVLGEYQGTVLFVSHDRHFINKIASHLITIDSGRLTLFPGNYEQFINCKKEQQTPKKENKLILEYRISEVLSKLSVTKDKTETVRLDKEYQELLAQIKQL